jgi:hypothetical protein
MKQKIMSIFTVLVMLVTSACTQDQRITSLEGVIDSLELLLPILEATNPQNANLYAMIGSAISGLPTALQQTQAELVSNDTDAIKAGKIATYFASSVLALNVLPPAAQAIASGVLVAIQKFLTSLSPYDGNMKLKASYRNNASHKYTLPDKYQNKTFDISDRVGQLSTTR